MKIQGGIMKNLKDYNGQFMPDLRLGDFSPDTLARMAELYCKLYIALDGFWYLTVKGRVSNEEALACDIQIWEKLSKYEMFNITKQMNIQGNDVIALMKAIQLVPWLQRMQYKIELKNHNNAILTVTGCPTLNALEKEGGGREDEICNIVEPRVLKGYASYFNPDIGVKCLKSPPRKSKDEICCQWEFSC